MSYILDALRRAEAERSRGQVPGLHAQPVVPGQVAPARWGGAWALGAGLAVLLTALAAAWWWSRPAANPGTPTLPAGATTMGSSTPTPSAPPPTRPAGPPGAPPGAPPALPPAVPMEPGAASPAGPTAPLAPATLPQVVSAPTPPPVQPGATPGREPAATAAPPTAVRPVVPAPGAAAPLPPPPAPTSAPRVLKLAELSAEQRRELPPMAVGGSIWSESAANRFVIINGQLVREGENAAPGVVLERIGQRSMQLRWRELRVEVPL